MSMYPSLSRCLSRWTVTGLWSQPQMPVHPPRLPQQKELTELTGQHTGDNHPPPPVRVHCFTSILDIYAIRFYAHLVYCLSPKLEGSIAFVVCMSKWSFRGVCVCVCMRTYVCCVCACVCICAYVWAYACICCTYKHLHTHRDTYVCTYTHTYT